MPRRDDRARRLVAGEATYLWSVRHAHRVPAAGGACAEAVVLRREGSHGSLRITFAAGPGRAVPDGLLPSGVVGTGSEALNLHQPGTARALLDEALARGWDPAAATGETVDGWTLFAATHARRHGTDDASGALSGALSGAFKSEPGPPR